MVDSDQASDQLEAQMRPIGAQNGEPQRLRVDQNPVGTMPVEQVGRRDAHGLRRKVTGKAGVTRLVIMMGRQDCHRLRSTPCLNRFKRPLQWPDLDEEQRDALRQL